MTSFNEIVSSPVPCGYLIGTILCALGFVLIILNEIKILILLDYFNKGILVDHSTFPRITSTFFEVFFILLTFALVVIVVVAVFLRRKESYKRWNTNVRESVACVALLSLTFVFHLIWCFKICWSVYYLALYRTDKQACTDFYYYPKKKDRYFLCISMAFVGSRKRRRICDDEVIKQFCYNFADHIWMYEIGYAIGCFCLISGLSIYMCCLSMNYRALKMKERKAQEALSNLVVVGKALWSSEVPDMPDPHKKTETRERDKFKE